MACGCLELLKAKLAETNTVPISVILLDGSERLTIRTDRLRALRDGKKATPVIAAHCPVCGVHY